MRLSPTQPYFACSPRQTISSPNWALSPYRAPEVVVVTQAQVDALREAGAVKARRVPATPAVSDALGRCLVGRHATRISLLDANVLIDVYLLALAAHNGGPFVTLDGAIALQAVHGAKVGDGVRLV